MICKTCAQAADLGDQILHEACPGPSWCDCQHLEIIDGQSRKGPSGDSPSISS